eukprot:6099617-Pyramimonas_sp.AAC.1
MRPPHPSWHCHPPSTAFRGPTGSPTEVPSGAARVRPPCLIWHFHMPSIALRGLTGSFTAIFNGTARMRPPQGAPPKPRVRPPAC